MPNFFSAFNLSQLAAGVAEKALLMLPMVLLIIAREIDLSVASILALTSVLLGPAAAGRCADRCYACDRDCWPAAC